MIALLYCHLSIKLFIYLNSFINNVLISFSCNCSLFEFVRYIYNNGILAPITLQMAVLYSGNVLAEMNFPLCYGIFNLRKQSSEFFFFISHVFSPNKSLGKVWEILIQQTLRNLGQKS